MGNNQILGMFGDNIEYRQHCYLKGEFNLPLYNRIQEVRANRLLTENINEPDEVMKIETLQQIRAKQSWTALRYLATIIGLILAVLYVVS